MGLKCAGFRSKARKEGNSFSEKLCIKGMYLYKKIYGHKTKMYILVKTNSFLSLITSNYKCIVFYKY